MKSAAIFLFTIIISLSIYAQELSNNTFKYTYGSHKGYVDNNLDIVIENVNLAYYAETVRADTSFIIFEDRREDKGEVQLGMMDLNNDIIISPRFHRIQYINNQLFFGSNKMDCKNGLYYKLYSVKEQKEIFPDCFKIRRKVENVYVLKSADLEVYLLDLNSFIDPSFNDLKIFKIYGNKSLEIVYEKNGISLYKVMIPKINDEKFDLKSVDNKLFELVGIIEKGSSFKADVSSKKFNVYKDWCTNDTLIASLSNVLWVEDEYFSHIDSLFYYICLNYKSQWGIKSQLDETSVEFSDKNIRSFFAIDSLLKYVRIQNADKLYGIFTHKNEEIIPDIYKKIFFGKFFGKKVFICTDTTNHVGVMDTQGKVIIPFIYEEIIKKGNLIAAQNENGIYYLNEKLDTLFYMDDRSYSFIALKDGYYLLHIFSLKLSGFKRADLSFVIDEKGKYYLPEEIEEPLRKRINIYEKTKD